MVGRGSLLSQLVALFDRRKYHEVVIKKLAERHFKRVCVMGSICCNALLSTRSSKKYSEDLRRPCVL